MNAYGVESPYVHREDLCSDPTPHCLQLPTMGIITHVYCFVEGFKRSDIKKMADLWLLSKHWRVRCCLLYTSPSPRDRG